MYKILIADDETPVRMLLEKNLRLASLPIEIVGSAEDGQEAYVLAVRLRPDIIITDIAMPHMNGLELISRLQAEEVPVKSIIISGYDEFDYAKTAIALGVTEYLLKPFSPGELQEAVSKLIHELDNQKRLYQNLNMLMAQADRHQAYERESALRRLLNGESLSERERRALDFLWVGKLTHFLSCIIRLKGACWNFQNAEQAEEFVKLLHTGYFGKDLQFYGLSLDPDKMIFCFCASKATAEDLQAEVLAGLKRLARSLKTHYDIQLYSSVGRVYERAQQLSASYQDALVTWKDALNPEKEIHVFGENDSAKADEARISAEIRNTKTCIRGAVCKGEEAEALALLQQLMRLYAHISHKGSGYILVSIGELVYGIEADMEKNGFERVDEALVPRIESVDHYISLLELRERVSEYLRLCCEKIRGALSTQSARAAVHVAQAYLEEHLGEREVSVELVASAVHFSVSYLRQIFKEITGESFNEYLIRRRMEHAGRLLLGSSMKIQEIAERCGYENQRYFASSFKKFFGCTPTEYKRMMEQSG